MPETPDFEMLASDLAAVLRHDELETSEMDDAVVILKQLWNARGAADIATIETSLTSQMGATASGPYLKNLDRELRKLDR